jgi:hypothetical protein
VSDAKNDPVVAGPLGCGRHGRSHARRLDRALLSGRLLFSRNKAKISIGKKVTSILCQNKSKANRENSP